MSTLCLRNGIILSDGRRVAGDVLIRDGVIVGIGDVADPAVPCIDCSGRFLVPGFVDPHTHGCGGIDVNGATAEDFDRMSRVYARTGVTAFVASIAADDAARTVATIEAAVTAMKRGCSGARLLGIHLEGPFVAPEYRATFDAEYVVPVDVDLVRRYQAAAEGHIVSITVAPELPGMDRLIPACVQMGMRVSMGHSGASYDDTMRAIKWGATAVTHLGNAMRPLHHRGPGILGAALDSDVYVELILDGVHVHPAFARTVLRAKGRSRVMAVSDSMMATGLGDGAYRLGSRSVVVRDGISRREDGGLAGSTLTLDRALRNVADWTRDPIETVLPLVGANALRWLGMDDRKGAIAEGMEADVVVLNDDLTVTSVVIGGRSVTA